MNSFFDVGVAQHIDKNGVLSKIDVLINWCRIEKILGDVHSDLGRTGYDVVQLFKCLLLQSWHSLSDPGLEEALRVRLDFMVFTRFSIGDKLPDETTFCRFRNKLVAQNKYEKLLQEINRQLEKHHLKVKQASVAIVDATLIEANARPNSVYKETEAGNFDQEQSKDPDARWLKKGKKSHFGYQAFSRCDAEGYIDKTHVTPANLSEFKQLENMTEGLEKGVRVQTDKGFSSVENKQNLRNKGLKNGLMYRAYRNKPLSKRMKQFNKLISQTRYRIEQSFGTIKRRFSYQKASYFTTEKVNAQFSVKAMCLNLLKACNKIQIV